MQPALLPRGDALVWSTDHGPTGAPAMRLRDLTPDQRRRGKRKLALVVLFGLAWPVLLVAWLAR